MLAGCSPLKLINLAVPRGGYEVIGDIAYGGHPRQRLDIYVPDGLMAPAPVAPKPVVVFFHGGRWQFGDKDRYRFAGQALASEGYVAVLSSYRLYPEIRFPSIVEDGAKAVDWVHNHIGEYGGNSRCIYLMGHSSGAHTAAMLALDERYLRDVGVGLDPICGMIGLAGPYDFLPLTADDLKDLFSTADDIKNTQPIHFVDGQGPPLLLLHGLEDDTVKLKNSVNLARRVCEAGGEAKLITYPGRGHAGMLVALAAPLRFLAPVLEDTAGFIEKTAGRRRVELCGPVDG